MPPSPGPSPDATTLPLGRSRLRVAVPGALILLGAGAVGVFGLWRAATGRPVGDAGTAAVGVGSGFLVLVGALGGLLFAAVWRARNETVSVDAHGVWLAGPRGTAVVPWRSLAGAGLTWVPRPRFGRSYSLELFPAQRIGPAAAEHPVLKPLIRDDTPLRAELPGQRYRLPLPTPARARFAEAVRGWAPHLWRGESRRPGA